MSEAGEQLRQKEQKADENKNLGGKGKKKRKKFGGLIFYCELCTAKKENRGVAQLV